MKKIAFLLALLTAATVCLAACQNESEGENSTTESTTNSTTVPSTPRVTTVDFGNNNDPTTNEEPEAPALLDSSKFALDGDLSEYEGLKTISVLGQKVNDEITYEHKKVIFYGAMTDAGLYLAADAYHDVYLGASAGEWWTNTNFEFFIGVNNTQKYVYAMGIDADCATSGDDVQAVMKTEEINGDTKYHTITEVFISTDAVGESNILYNTVDVGVAWKTIGDMIVGGAAANQGANGEDEYWIPSWPSEYNKPIVAPSGIYMPGEYEF